MIKQLEEFWNYMECCNSYGKKALVRGLISINKLYLQKYYLKKILDFAKEHNLKFTVFITAKNLTKKKKLIKRLMEDGHEIGCHGYNHIYLAHKSDKEIEKELETACREFKKNNIETKGFRAPFLSYNNHLIKTLKKFDFIYSSNKLGGNFSKYKNGILEVPVIEPYDWEAFVGYGLSIKELKQKWKGKKGCFLFHPWVITTNLKEFRELFSNQKDFRIITNLDGLSIGIDAY